MSEPLKGRHKVYMQDYIESGISQGVELDDIIFKKEDIKSAVEWLKRQFRRNKSGTDNIFSNTFIEKKINEAFEDVTLSDKGGSK